MAFLKLAEGVKDFEQAKGAAAVAEIFDSSKAQALDDLETSIEQAKGRYEGEGQGAASKGNPIKVGDEVHEKAFASPNWRPQTVPVYVPFTTAENKVIKDLRKKIEVSSGADEEAFKKALKDASKRVRVMDKNGDPASRIRMHKDGGEMVRISIKCKGAIIDGFLENKHGDPAKTLQLSSNDLITQLESYKEAIAGMDKDSAMGKHWHNAAVHNSIPPKERNKIDKDGVPKHVAHCLESDKWVKKGDVKQESPYPTVAIEAKVKRE